MIADCHLHTEFSSDSRTPVRDQIEKAISLGMDYLCVTDHMDMDYPGGEFCLDTDSYAACIRGLQEEYRGRIRIGLGVELGLQEHLKERQQEYLKKYPFDFVIGSVHLIHGEDPYYGGLFQRIGDGEAYREYFRASYQLLLEEPGIQTWGHLGYVVRYGLHKDAEYSYEKYAEEIDAILRLLVEKGIALELNTAGFRMLGKPNPRREILERYRHLGGELITVGSDGHEPGYLGWRFGDARNLLWDCGFRYYTVFHERKPEFLKL